uniref:Uncharacterized protein n=1 Tax=Anopheles maculatus TaxID=74869 RepID=A0A182SVQ9_9DIPT
MTDINRTKQSYLHKHNGKSDPQSAQTPSVLHSTGSNTNEHGRAVGNGAGTGSSSGGSLKRNNSHHQRLKKSNTSTLDRSTNGPVEYGADRTVAGSSSGSFGHHQQQQQTGTTCTRSGAGSGLAKSWSKNSSSSTSQSTSLGPAEQTQHTLETGSGSGRPPGTNLAPTIKTEASLTATATLTRAGGFGGGVGGGSILKNATNSSHQDPVGSRNSLKRGPGGLSTLSLCSCDAETEPRLTLVGQRDTGWMRMK